jgi:hypothetical protein
VIVWLLLFTGSAAPFYVGGILLLLPIAFRGVDLVVEHVRRPAGSTAAYDSVPSVTAVTIERGLRAALLIGLHVAAMTMQDTMATRLLRGVDSLKNVALRSGI